MNDNPAFDIAYNLSRKHEIRALAAIADPEGRSAAADSLASRGFIVDPFIDLGENPWKEMMMRQLYGFPWIAPLGKPPVIISPGPGQILTPFTPVPDYAILTSTKISDYPPIDPVIVVPPTATSSDPVHAFANVDDNGDELYFSDPDDRSPLGAVWPTSNTHPHFVKSVMRQTPWGLYQRWKKVA